MNIHRYITIILAFFFLCTLSAQKTEKHIGLEQGMKSGRVMDMAQDEKGCIWMATERGLHCWDGYRFTIYDTYNSELTSNELNALLIDADGKGIWIGTQRDGLCLLNTQTGEWQTWKARDGLLADGITRLSRARDGGIWITYYLNGIDHRSVDGVITHYSKRNVKGLDGLNWVAIEDGKGKLYVGHVFQGMSVIDLEKMTAKNYRWEANNANSIGGDEVHTIIIDSLGRIIVGTNNDISVFDPDNDCFVEHHPTSSPVLSLLATNNGAIEKGLQQEGVFAMMQDKQGNLWRADGRHGVSVTCHENPLFTKKDTTLLPHSYSGIGNVQFVCKAGDTTLVATINGLWRIDDNGDEKEMTTINEQLDVKNINSMAVDRQGNLWLGTFGSGIYLFEPDGKLLAHHQEAPSVYINDVMCDSKGQVWVASRLGLALFADTQKPQEMKVYGSKEGLDDNFLRAIIEDDAGNVWMSSTNDISCLDTSTGRILNYNHTDGIPFGEFQKGLVMKTIDGCIIFGQEQGACIFRPADFKKERELSPFFISSFTLFSTNNKTGEEEKRQISFGKETQITLRHNENTFRIAFGVADLAQVNAIEFQYMIDGLDDNWYTLGSEREVTLHSLPPGNYLFRLRNRLKNGQWSSQEEILPITVCQPWWWTWWAKISYLLIIFLLIWHEYRQYHQQLLLRRRLDERITRLYATDRATDVINETAEPCNEEACNTPKETEPEKERAPIGNAADNDFLNRMDAIILENLEKENFDVQFLADKMCISHSALYRRLKSLTGMTVNEYVRKHRLAGAMQLIRNGKSIADVCMLCGFNSPNYFRRCFKAEYGMLPSEVD